MLNVPFNLVVFFLPFFSFVVYILKSAKPDICKFKTHKINLSHFEKNDDFISILVRVTELNWQLSFLSSIVQICLRRRLCLLISLPIFFHLEMRGDWYWVCTACLWVLHILSRLVCTILVQNRNVLNGISILISITMYIAQVKTIRCGSSMYWSSSVSVLLTISLCHYLTKHPHWYVNYIKS